MFFNKCNQEETETTRGRTPAHETRVFQKTLHHDLLINKCQKQLLRRKMGIMGAKINANNELSMESNVFKLFNSWL